MTITHSEHLLIVIGTEIEVFEFSDAGECQDAFLEAIKKPYVKDAVTIYKHHGTGPIHNTWWGGLWPGYAKRDGF